jgi:hypothetical protein
MFWFKKKPVKIQSDLDKALEDFLDAEERVWMFDFEFEIKKERYKYAIREYKRCLNKYKKLKDLVFKS